MKFVQSRSSSNARLEVLEQLLLCESEKGVEFETKARVLNNIATARSRLGETAGVLEVYEQARGVRVAVSLLYKTLGM